LPGDLTKAGTASLSQTSSFFLIFPTQISTIEQQKYFRNIHNEMWKENQLEIALDLKPRLHVRCPLSTTDLSFHHGHVSPLISTPGASSLSKV
jgi:hypothetical protein